MVLHEINCPWRSLIQLIIILITKDCNIWTILTINMVWNNITTTITIIVNVIFILSKLRIRLRTGIIISVFL